LLFFLSFPQESASSFAVAVVLAVALAFLVVIPQGSDSSFAVALAFLVVIPQGSDSSFAVVLVLAVVLVSEIGPGFSPGI